MVTMLPCGTGGTLFDDGGVGAAAPATVVEVEVDVEVDVAEVVVVAADRLERRDWAWSGEIVVVDKLATAPVVVEAWLPGLPGLRTSAPSISGWVSMNAIVGPATSWAVPRSITLLSNG